MATPEDECDDDDVLGERIDRPGDPGDDVAPKVVNRPGVKGSVLPFTGGDVFAMGALALGLIATGAGVAVGARRRHGIDQ